ncbi:Phage integrase family protein [Marinobacter sp. es.048]|uniref:tyrosine-type recombinase/integrase n=1 Tax=Marinobacter sp. es.048 TaxID=1761795 RepID=UPI000B59633F|nr:tyrosine-type recombinase/integrase [Marinobacter sp. es.048]SNC59436.1 Phage integrase family protein [Marinobacter sp. es.048]
MTKAIPTDRSLHGDEYRGGNRFNAQAKDRERACALDIIRTEFPEIYAPSKDKLISNTEVDALLERVSDGQPGQEKRARHNAVVAFLRAGASNHCWDVEIPAYAVMAQSEKAVAHPQSFAKLPPYRAMVDTFMESLEVSTPSASCLDENLLRYEAGQLIFSMISQGGLHHRLWLQKTVEALPLGVVGRGQLIWLDVECGSQLRRWFPDPISALLIRRWFRRWQQQWPDATPEQLLNVFLATAPASPTASAMPKSFRAISSAAVTASSTYHSGVIRNYQTTRNASVSLPETAWRRLQTKEVPRRTQSEPHESTHLSHTTPVVDTSVLVGEGTDDGLVTLDRVRKALSSIQNGKAPTRKMMAESLTQVAANQRLAPIVRVLSLWCRDLITSRLKSGKSKLTVSSAKTYLSRIGPPLAVALARVTDLNELGDDDWEFIYEGLIGSAKSSSHGLNRAIQARRFHQFLVDHFAFPEVHIEGGAGGGRVVDADILTAAEYMRAKQILQLHSADSRMARIRTLVLTLGFRCGLRRGEVQKIQLRDLPGVSEPELENPQLLIRPSAFGSVKTNAAIRRLPLSVLLTAEELRELRYWTQQRLSEQVAPQPMELLFCKRHQSQRVLSSLELFDPIQEAMQMASGTKLRFHHLRHAFATFTGLRLLESVPGELMREAWAMDDEGKIVMPHWGKDFSALADLASSGSATVKRLWLLGQWCGHVTPGETLKSYSHLIDWVSFHERLAGENTALSIRQQAYLLGDSVKSVSVFRTRNGLKGSTKAIELLSAANSHWPDGFRKIREDRLQTYRSPIVPGQVLEEAVKPNITAMKLYNIFQRIGALQARGKSETKAIEESAAYYSQGVEDLAQWHQRAMQMMNDPSDKKAPIDKAGKPRENIPPEVIHRRWSVDHQSKLANPFVESSGQPSATRPELIQCPAPPTPHVAQEYCEAVFERLVSWSDSEPQAFSEAMNAVQNAMQRSHPQISFRSDENKKRYRQLLRQANLCHLVRVHVKPPPTRDYKQDKLKNHWAAELGVSRVRVKLLSESAKSDRSEWGVGQINIIPDASLGDAARQMTMSTVRFAIFMAAVVFEGELAIDKKRREASVWSLTELRSSVFARQ